MTDRLRTIAVTVEESERGVFHWVLIESIDDPTGFTVLFGSAEVFGNWEDAPAWIWGFNAKRTDLL